MSTTTDTNDPRGRATAPGDIPDPVAREMLRQQFDGQAPRDLKLDERIDVRIDGARVMYTTRDHSDRAHNLTVVLHKGVRYVLAAEPGAVTIGRSEPEIAGPPEPVISEDARKILDGLNGFASYRPGCDFMLAEAIDWAIRQPEVAGTDGPNAEGEYLVELLDFTCIEFDAKTRQWAVTVSDDAEAVTR